MINLKVKCDYCEKDMESKSIRKRFCSDKCRTYFRRQKEYETSWVGKHEKIALETFKKNEAELILIGNPTESQIPLIKQMAEKLVETITEAESM